MGAFLTQHLRMPKNWCQATSETGSNRELACGVKNTAKNIFLFRLLGMHVASAGMAAGGVLPRQKGCRVANRCCANNR